MGQCRREVERVEGEGVDGGVTGARALPLERAVPSLPVQTSPGPAAELSSPARRLRPLPFRSLRNESEGRQCHVSLVLTLLSFGFLPKF